LSAGRNLSFIGTPAAEVEIDAALVTSLLQDQHPDLAHLPLRQIDAGWDNAMYRLGDDLCVRLPRRKLAKQLIENEQAWLPLLADRLSFSVPTPVRIGKPALGYPWRWSVLPWLAGVSADLHEPHPNQAKPFAAFLRSLHEPAPADAPSNNFRGVPLSQRAASVEERMQRLESKSDLITQRLRQIWKQALSAPIDVEAKWLHGDLHARNILVEDAVITGVIDWGDITSGDVATDLSSIWMLFSDARARQQVLVEYGTVSQATLQRAKGWAILVGVALLDTGLIDNSRHAVMGERTLRRVAED